MQPEKPHRSNVERTAQTRHALLSAARSLFTATSYADTSTPDVAKAAGVTRGALYHHFTDKQALFHAVVEEEARIVAEEITKAVPRTRTAKAALLAGTDAYLAAMQVPGRTRLLLIDGPAVLGRAAVDAIDARHAGRTLREGLEEARTMGALSNVDVDALTALLSAAFDRCALALEAGAPLAPYRKALAALLDGVLRVPKASRNRS